MIGLQYSEVYRAKRVYFESRFQNFGRDVAFVKGAELIRNVPLSAVAMPVPSGVVVYIDRFDVFLRGDMLNKALDTLDKRDSKSEE
ncbi:hypothetical protein WSO01_10980 [Weissella soli]|nr:hypothetical protein WSO01_10980 [Weissella soli]